MRRFIVGILSVILIIFISVNNLYMAIGDGISVESIHSSTSSINLFSGLIYDDNGNKTDIFRAILELTTLDEDTVIRLMENERANEILTDVVNSIYDYNLTGDVSYKYSGEKIRELIYDNMDQILSEIDYHISSNDRQEVLDYVDSHIDYIVDTIYGIDIGGYVRD
jgi:hypothetical protein